MSEKIENEKQTITLRIPAGLNDDLKALAKEERRSVSQQVVVILESATKYLREKQAA